MNDTSNGYLARRLVPAMGLTLLACACVDSVSTRSVFVTQPAVSTQPRVVSPLPDVSARKCADDGFELVAIYNESGVPERHVCVDRHSGRKCESWAYYRGECVLGAKWDTIPGSSPAPREGATAYMSNCGSNEQSGETHQSVTGGACPSDIPSYDTPAGSGGPRLESGDAGE